MALPSCLIFVYREGQQNGIWAWDCNEKEKCPILLIPSVFALLGDNPMQSEMACHRGLMAKFFCRLCWVQGHDSENPKSTAAETGQDSERGSEGESEDQSNLEPPGVAKASRKKTETKEQMIDRVTRFMEVVLYIPCCTIITHSCLTERKIAKCL